MYINLIKTPSPEDWKIVKDSALRTLWKSATVEPDTEWKLKILRSEHSPIRTLQYIWEWVDIPYWVSVHIRTHKVGIFDPTDEEHFVSSQRNDRQDKYDRTLMLQSAPVIHRICSNAQAIMNVSRKRLCKNASKETTESWQLFLDSIKPTSPELFLLCVPDCIYRGGLCGEFKSCGWIKSKFAKIELNTYQLSFK